MKHLKPQNREETDIQAFLENLCIGVYDELGTCLWDLAELRVAIEALLKQSRTHTLEAVLGELPKGKTPNWDSGEGMGGQWCLICEHYADNCHCKVFNKLRAQVIAIIKNKMEGV